MGWFQALCNDKGGKSFIILWLTIKFMEIIIDISYSYQRYKATVFWENK
jgi:hypothetical protein